MMAVVIVVAMAVAMIVVTIVMLLPTLLAALFLALLVAKVLLVVLTLPFAHVPRLVLPGLHEVHLPIARMILVAMQTPRSSVLRRNVQIQRLCHDHMRRRLLDDDRPGIDQCWRRPATEIYAAVDARRNLSLNGH